jgi:hypothetical protein
MVRRRPLGTVLSWNDNELLHMFKFFFCQQVQMSNLPSSLNIRIMYDPSFPRKSVSCTLDVRGRRKNGGVCQELVSWFRISHGDRTTSF